MDDNKQMIVFGPVPSRRLGQSMGINNIPPKICSYSCVYCQLGRTIRMQSERRKYYRPDDIFKETEIKMKELNKRNEHVDYFTFVPDGEPTLDKNLGKEIELVKQFGVKTAVITNASLLWMDEVKEDLMKADWVSLKADAADDETWRKIDRPHGHLDIDSIMKGTLEFAKSFKGRLVTETMLVKGYNTGRECIDKIGNYIKGLNPAMIYLLVPTRPPAESGIERPSREELGEVFKNLHDLTNIEIEAITGDEGESFFFADDVINDFLSIISVHPVKEEVIYRKLKERNIDKSIIKKLKDEDMIEEFTYEKRKFFLKKTGKKNSKQKREENF
jgi:wyosine [tRNA(Phe)-imidazoG37] synthetase (radical SAM superfamily)